MSYIPREYWLERGKVYKQEFQYNKKFKLQEQMLIEYLKRNISFSTVLEVGCGFGRITRILLSNFPEISEYIAVDLSPEQIENAKNYVMEADKRGVVRFIVSDIQSLKINLSDLIETKTPRHKKPHHITLSINMKKSTMKHLMFPASFELPFLKKGY